LQSHVREEERKEKEYGDGKERERGKTRRESSSNEGGRE
jgi:hypothetical protein